MWCSRRYRHLGMIAVLFALSACITLITPEEIGTDELIVVEGLITDQETQQKVTISLTTSLNDTAINYVSGAEVWMVDQDNQRVDFYEDTPGNYLTENPYAATINGSLQLFFSIESRAYQSSRVTVQPSAPIDSLYALFVPDPTFNNIFGGQFTFYLDAASNPKNVKYYRWTWDATYEFKVRDPSRWFLNDGEFVNRDLGGEFDSLQVEVCWKSIDNDRFLIEELQVPELGIQGLPLLSFHSDTKYMVRGYSAEIRQYGLSVESYNYWKLLAELNEEQGSLAALQPGTIVGNISSTTNPQEIVLGYFDASQERRYRKQFDPLDFLESGYKAIRPNLITCDGVDSLTSAKTPEAVADLLSQIGDNWLLAYFTTANAVYLPKSCSDCRLYGTNIKPDFWQ